MDTDYRESVGIILGCKTMREHLIYGEVFEGHLRDVIRTCAHCERTYKGNFVNIYHSDTYEEQDLVITTVCEHCHRYL